MAPSALPTELINLLNLHSSFLTALSLYYAHNGTAVPVDLRILTTSIAQVWQKRRVTNDDIRLLVGVLDAAKSGNQAQMENPFYLSDYSGGKICLEIREEGLSAGAMGVLNEDALQAMFMESLDQLWRAWSSTHTSASKNSPARPIATPKRRGRPRKVTPAQPSIEAFVDENAMEKFIAQLPLAPITLCASATAVAPLGEKGRKRLRDFKESVAQGQNRSAKKLRESTGKENEPSIASPSTNASPLPAQQQQQQQKITSFTSVRKSNLLDRILAKQALASTSPTASLTPAQLQRRAALQRSEEIITTLSLLTASKGNTPRVSFSMAALVQQLQGSIRSPLSREDVVRVVEVIASEVAPGYVSVHCLGSMRSVVLVPGLRPRDVRARVEELCAF